MINHKYPCVYCAGRYISPEISKSDRCKYAHAGRTKCLDSENQNRLNDKYPGFNDGSALGIKRDYQT